MAGDPGASERWAAVDRYVADLLLAPDPVLDAALEANAAAGLPPHDDGRLVTLEIDPAYAEVARDNLRRTGLDDRVDVRVARQRPGPRPHRAGPRRGSRHPAPVGKRRPVPLVLGLHCFPDPAAAIAETVRLLAPSGRLVGCTFVRGTDSLRQRLLIRPGLGDFGQVPTAAEVEAHLAAADLATDSIDQRGPMLYFTGHR